MKTITFILSDDLKTLHGFEHDETDRFKVARISSLAETLSRFAKTLIKQEGGGHDN